MQQEGVCGLVWEPSFDPFWLTKIKAFLSLHFVSYSKLSDYWPIKLVCFGATQQGDWRVQVWVEFAAVYQCWLIRTSSWHTKVCTYIHVRKMYLFLYLSTKYMLDVWLALSKCQSTELIHIGVRDFIKQASSQLTKTDLKSPQIVVKLKKQNKEELLFLPGRPGKGFCRKSTFLYKYGKDFEFVCVFLCLYYLPCDIRDTNQNLC